MKNEFLRKSGILTATDREFFDRISVDMEDSDATLAIHQLSNYLYRYYGRKVIILLDEYDTPMQEAYMNGYWEELTSFFRKRERNPGRTHPEIWICISGKEGSDRGEERSFTVVWKIDFFIEKQIGMDMRTHRKGDGMLWECL